MKLSKLSFFLLVGAIGAIGFLAKNYLVHFDNNDFTYRPDATNFKGKDFTGISYKFYGNSYQIYKIQFFFQGKQELTEHRWHRNGTKWQEIQFFSGKRHGTHKAWYSSGKVHYLKYFVQDMAEGEFWGWHPNGIVSDFHFFKKNKQLVYKSFISDGKPYYNYVYHKNTRVGMQGGSYCKTKTASNM